MSNKAFGVVPQDFQTSVNEDMSFVNDSINRLVYKILFGLVFAVVPVVISCNKILSLTLEQTFTQLLFPAIIYGVNV